MLDLFLQTFFFFFLTTSTKPHSFKVGGCSYPKAVNNMGAALASQRCRQIQILFLSFDLPSLFCWWGSPLIRPISTFQKFPSVAPRPRRKNQPWLCRALWRRACFSDSGCQQSTGWLVAPGCLHPSFYYIWSPCSSERCFILMEQRSWDTVTYRERRSAFTEEHNVCICSVIPTTMSDFIPKLSSNCAGNISCCFFLCTTEVLHFDFCCYCCC